MGSLGLRGRVSTRASLTCSTVRHPSPANPSIQSSSSRPTAPIAMSPDIFDSMSRSILRSTVWPSSPLITLPSHCLSTPSRSSAPTPAQTASCGDGQFSDADTDEDITELHEKKRLKLDCFRSADQNCSPSATFETRRGTSSNLHQITNHQSNGDYLKGHSTKDAIAGELARKSQGQKVGVNTNARSGKTSIWNATSNQYSSSKCDSPSQLPMATRRLAMLAGIPESSQAIIQSTLSLPSSRLNPPSRPQSHSDTTYFPSASNCKYSVDSSQLSPSASSSYAKECGPALNPLINPALAAKNDCRSFSSHATGGQIIPNALPDAHFNSGRALTAPRYGTTSTSTREFTMPAPGTFSIRAPPSSQILRSFNCGPSPELSGATQESNGLGLNNCEEGSEADTFSQAPSTYCAPSLDYGSTHTAPTPGNSGADLSDSRKRKAKNSKPKPTGRNEAAKSELELVKPPPTINGKISHARKVPPGYVKRTPNSFLMFRSHVIANKLLPPGVENDNRQISRVVSGLWAGLSEDDLRTWQEASRELRAAVRAKNPGLKHAPNQKRKEVIRRRRNGQLPGETPEQRVEREKAAAAALAKVIMEGHGEKLDPRNLTQLADLSKQSSSSKATVSSRETSRPEFRAPGHRLNNSTLIQGITPRSEYAESTLTNSPAPDTHRSLSRVPETCEDMLSTQKFPLTPKTTESGLSVKSFNSRQNSNGRSPREKPDAHVHPVHDNRQNLDVKPSPQSAVDGMPPAAKSHPYMLSPTSPAPLLLQHQAESKASSNIFLALGSTGGVLENFPDTFSNEMLRSLGLTASDLDLNFSSSDRLSTANTNTMNNQTSSSKCLSADVDRPEQNSGVWSHETSFSTLVDFSATNYPFRDSTISSAISEGMSSQDTFAINDEDSSTMVDQLSQLGTSNPLELSSLINECYTDSLNCDGLDFDALYLNCTPNSATKLDLEDSCQSFSANLFRPHLGNAIEKSNPNHSNTLWDCQSS